MSDWSPGREAIRCALLDACKQRERAQEAVRILVSKLDAASAVVDEKEFLVADLLEAYGALGATDDEMREATW